MKTSAREWGTSGAGFLFVTKDKKVFLTLRTDDFEMCVNEPGEWAIPGGAVEWDEGPLRAARREVAEELTDGDVELLLKYEVAGSVVYRDEGFRYTTIVAVVSKEEADRWEWELNWENDDAGWFDLSDLPEPLHFGAEYVINRLSEVLDEYGTTQNPSYPSGEGDCYEAAFDTLDREFRDDPTVRLIHAIVVGQAPIEGVLHGHAWVEYSQELPVTSVPVPSIRIAVDTSQGRDLRLPADLYRMIGRIRDVRQYTRSEARRWAVDTKHFGPWEGGPWEGLDAE